MFYTEYCSSDEMCTESKTPAPPRNCWRTGSSPEHKRCTSVCAALHLRATPTNHRGTTQINYCDPRWRSCGRMQMSAARLPRRRSCLIMPTLPYFSKPFFGGISNGDSELFRQPPHGKIRTRDHEMSIITSWNLYLFPLLYWPKK